MSIRFSLRAASDITDDVRIDAHHIASDSTWFEHPIRSHLLRPGHDLCLLAHVALGFVLHKGGHADLVVEIEHDEPNAPHGLELIESAAPTEYPDVPPGAVTLDEAGADIEPLEVERLVVPPGGVARVQMRHATHLRLREVSMHEAYDDA